MVRLRALRTLMISACTVVLLSALTGCGTDTALPPSTSGPSTTTSSATALANVGDCRVESSSGLPEDAQAVPCAEPHDEEVFHAVPLTDETFSVEAVEEASAECLGAPFTDFIGLSKDASSIDVYVIAPTKENWDRVAPRELYCVLFDASGQISGSLAGTMR